MYKDHSDFPRLADEAVLWRYTSFTKFLSLLEKRALFFCRVSMLGDPYEGSISQASRQLLLNDIPSGPYLLAPLDLSGFPDQIFVNCWHESNAESEAMWRLYAKDREGVAIKTVASRFKEALVDEHDVYVAPVQYRDYKTDMIPFGNVMLPFFFKRLSFRHEHEVRALIWLMDNGGLDASTVAPKGVYCAVSLPTLIDEIVVAPFAAPWFIDLVRSVAGRYGLGERVRGSELSSEPALRVAHMPIPTNENPANTDSGGD